MAITLGDPNGIGPEVVLKCLDDPLVQSRTEPIVVGSPEVLRIHAKKLGRRLPPLVEDLEAKAPKRAIRIANTSQETRTVVEMGKLTPRGGNMAMFAVDEGIRLVQEGTASALVTGPISKLAIVRAGYNFPGHTEYLAKKMKVKEHVMMMVAKGLRISLATGHIPLKQVPERVTVNGLIAKLKRVKASLVQDFGIVHPKIAILGLNPHAGEDGVLGNEETEVIIEAIKGAGRRSILALGPFPADGFFGNGQYCGYDGVMAMYHDQGLIPFKTLSFGSGVNFTAGLPIVRTSPDHGTAFGIAGQARADAGSMIQAVLLAASVAEQRQQQS
ncbi:MAG: 4-hydroxythreonine-4-phosphate dehydrogenase PdxA [Bacteroidetes bacterium]|nr:4-hydroxythreonine-4-phosphate dehydrogenase PdxA [Bacteroidota bacterium]